MRFHVQAARAHRRSELSWNWQLERSTRRRYAPKFRARVMWPFARMRFSISTLCKNARMFNIDIKLKVADREVSPEQFAALFLKEILKAAQIEIAPKPTLIPPPIPRREISRESKEERPRVVRIEEAAHL